MLQCSSSSSDSDFEISPTRELKPMPRLINSSRIHFPKNGYIEFGILPSIEDGNVRLSSRAMIVAGKSWIILDDEEAANLFIFLRRQKKFSNISGADEYHGTIAENFGGVFFLRKENIHKYELLFMNERDEYSGTYLEHTAIVYMLENEMIINHQILRLALSCGDLLEKLDIMAIDCDGDASAVKKMAQKSSDTLPMEMALNHFDFFNNFIAGKSSEN